MKSNIANIYEGWLPLSLAKVFEQIDEMKKVSRREAIRNSLAPRNRPDADREPQ